MRVCKSLWKTELRRTEPFLDCLYDSSILSKTKPMPKSKKKPRPAWDTLFGALKENGNVRDMTKIYLEIQSQALNLHYYETDSMYQIEFYLPFINEAIFQKSYIGKQLESKIYFVMKQNCWKRKKWEPNAFKDMEQAFQYFQREQLEKLINELGEFQKPEMRLCNQDTLEQL